MWSFGDGGSSGVDWVAVLGRGDGGDLEWWLDVVVRIGVKFDGSVFE